MTVRRQPDLGDVIRRLERRIDVLERRNLWATSSVEVGGVRVAAVTTAGWGAPEILAGWTDAAETAPTTTSASLVTMWSHQVEHLSTPVLTGQVAVTVPASNTATVQLAATGGLTSSTLALSEGSWTVLIGWEHGATLGSTILFELQARRDTGAGSITVARPTLGSHGDGNNGARTISGGIST